MDSRKKKRPEEIAIKHAKNGGFIVRHSFNNMGSGESYQPDEQHAFTSHKEMLAHVTKHTAHSPFGADTDDIGGRHPVGDTNVRTRSTTPAGVAHKAKAAPPTRRTYGAGAD